MLLGQQQFSYGNDSRTQSHVYTVMRVTVCEYVTYVLKAVLH